jgi:transposase-like protein
LYCLSKCRKLIGSFGSSFTEAAWQIGGMAKRRACVLPSMVAEFAGLTAVDALPDEAACFGAIRRTRWARVVFCPECGGDEVVPRGADHTLQHLHTYLCRNCVRPFNDLTGTVLAGRAEAIRPWLVCLCYVNQGLPTETIARHLHLTVDEVTKMRALLGQRPQADSEGADVDGA